MSERAGRVDAVPAWSPPGDSHWVHGEVTSSAGLWGVLVAKGYRPAEIDDQLIGVVLAANDISDPRRVARGTAIMVPSRESYVSQRAGWDGAVAPAEPNAPHVDPRFIEAARAA